MLNKKSGSGPGRPTRKPPSKTVGFNLTLDLIDLIKHNANEKTAGNMSAFVEGALTGKFRLDGYRSKAPKKLKAGEVVLDVSEKNNNEML